MKRFYKGILLGRIVGLGVGFLSVGRTVGLTVGRAIGFLDGLVVGEREGTLVGDMDGDVGLAVRLLGILTG